MQFTNVGHPSLDVVILIPNKKTFCWKSAQGMGRLATSSQIDHFQGASVHPKCHFIN
jgi:hypothetical protein